MNLLLRPFALLALASALAGLTACGAPAEGEAETDGEIGSEASALTSYATDAEQFRNVFYSYAKNDDGYSEADVRKLIFLPEASDIHPAVHSTSGEDPLAPYDEYFQGDRRRPSTLYDNGVATAFDEIPEIESELKKHGPVTLLFIPGIFGEFIETPPFQELFAKGPSTAFGKTWAERLKSHADHGDTLDPMYSLKALGDESYPLGELVDAASIDDKDGNPLVNVLFMKAKMGSLETVGKIQDRTVPYLRRINKLFRVLDTPDRAYLLGYSRGAMLALDVLSTAASDTESNPWVKNVAGVITLGGVIYGTQLADPMFTPGGPKNGLVATAEALSTGLQSCEPGDSLLARSGKILANTKLWTTAASKLSEVATSGSSHPEMELEGLDYPTPDFGSLFHTLQQLLFENVLRLDGPVAQYCENVDRFKILTKALIDGGSELTTASRLEWWRTHTVPSDIEYFSIAATMGDASTRDNIWPVATNDVAYTPGSTDFRNLRSSFYDLYQESGIMLNDSQVPYSRAQFWPEVHASLNPMQGSIHTRLLALIDQDHWGFVLRRVIDDASGEVSPFPRTTLLKTIGTYVALAH